MLKDLDELSCVGYKTFDIENNILFDGNRLVAIDTLDYKKEKGLFNKVNKVVQNSDFSFKAFKVPICEQIRIGLLSLATIKSKQGRSKEAHEHNK